MTRRQRRTRLKRRRRSGVAATAAFGLVAGAGHAAAPQDIEVVPVKDIRPLGDAVTPARMLAAGDFTLFKADDGATGVEPWVSDGTGGGTVLLKDIAPPSSDYPYGDSRPSGLTAFGDEVLFVADDDAHGRELWKTDGTTAGTTLVKDIKPGSLSSYPRHLVVLGDQVLFRADDGAYGAELWRSDGTEAGTVLVKDLHTGSAGSYPRDLAAMGDAVFFTTDGVDLWRTDGTSEGTGTILDAPPLGLGGNPRFLTASGATLFFAARDGNGGTELWRSDGTGAGTAPMDGSSTEAAAIQSPENLTAAGEGELFFTAERFSGRELFFSDGTYSYQYPIGPQGTIQVADIATGSADSDPGEITPFADGVLFAATSGDGRELWMSDGTSASQVKDLNPAGSGAPHELEEWEGEVLFAADDGSTGTELWRTDGTGLGTTLAADTEPGPVGGDPEGLTSAGPFLLFGADDRLWKVAPREASPPPPPSRRCAGLPVTRLGSPAADRITGTGKRDVILALGGNDRVVSAGGHDVICGGPGKDLLVGGRGRDRLLGEAGRDRLLGGGGADALAGGPGRDLLLGGAGGPDRCNGGPGPDRGRCERRRSIP